jgi:uncharacterized heparinase superfamily protein
LAQGEGDFTEDKNRSSADDEALWRRFRGTAGEDAKALHLQRLKPPSGSSGAGESFTLYLRNLLPPDNRRGAAIAKGVWRIGQQRLVLPPGQPPWAGAMPSRHFADRVHRFAWLPDLIAHDEEAAELARSLADDWVHRYGKFDGFSWRLEAAATRAWNWLRCGPALFETGPEELCRERIACLARQLRYVADAVEAAHDPQSRWLGAVSLVAYALCLRRGAHLSDALSRLEAETTAQILPDGGHVTRSPENLLVALIQLQTLEDALARSGRPVPDWMSRCVPRMGAMLAFFRMGDGGLCPFNDSSESRPAAVEAALSRLPAQPRQFMFAPKSGFQKIEKGTMCLFLDCGEAPPRPFGDYARAGALSFELADGPGRLVTSCGHSAEVNVDWQAAVRGTSAHSTLVLGGRDSGRFVANDETRLRALIGPEGIAAKRLEESSEIWLDAQHAGYKAAFGLLHRRRVFVSGTGQRITGEDALVRPISQGPTTERKFFPFEIRFHLHPTVTAMTEKEGIRLTSEAGPVWMFKTSHEGARLETSIYLGRGIVEPTEQIVLAGFADPNGDGTDPPNCIRWAFRRERGPA